MEWNQNYLVVLTHLDQIINVLQIRNKGKFYVDLEEEQEIGWIKLNVDFVVFQVTIFNLPDWKFGIGIWMGSLPIIEKRPRVNEFFGI